MGTVGGEGGEGAVRLSYAAFARTVAAATISFPTGPTHRECAVSQPEMQPEEAPRRYSLKKGFRRGRGYAEGAFEGACGPAGNGDLRGRPFPLGDWGEPAERLDELYRWAEARALRTADWYLRDRMWKRRGARALRCAAALSAASGAVLLLLTLTGGLSTGGGSWGYVALLLAVVCLVTDRCFGLTSGWMRDIATAQAVQRRLEAFQFDWASESVREVLGPAEGTASEAAERCLGVLRRFCEDVSDLVQAETTGWMLEFRRLGAPVHPQAPAPGDHRGDQAQPPARPQLLPPNRATMPRQRPPEAR